PDSYPLSLHDALPICETLALARADDVDELTGFEDVDRELLAEGVLGGVGGADLGEVAAGRDARLLEVTGGRLGDLAGVDRAVGDLDRLVAVLLRRAHLGDD